MIVISIIRNILVRVGADIQPLQRNMAQAQRSMGGFQSAMRVAASNTSLSMSSVVASLGMGRLAFVALGAAAVATSVLVGKSAIKAAMDVVESESLFEVSMGSMAASARKWSNELQSSLGLNAYEVRKNVGLFYNMTTSMGLTRNQAYKLSTDLTKLAYDMSSFYNMPVDEMFVKLQAGIAGETEPLKRIGILVLENVVKQYAYQEGIANVGAELTEQQKVMARYIAIMAQTKNANGDLARTIMSPANQLRLLRMQLQLASVNLGNAFMPIVTIVLPILTNFTKGLVRVTNTFAQFMGALFGTSNAQAQNAQSAADAAAAQKGLGNATKAAGDKAKKGVAGFDEINQLQEDLAASAEEAADAMGGSSTMPTPEKQDTGTSVIPQSVLDMASKAREALKPVGDYFSEIGGMVKNFWKDIQPALQPIIDFIVKVFQPVWEGLAKIISIVFNTIKDVIGGALQVIKGILEVFAGLLTGDWNMLWQGLKDIVSGAWTIIKAVVTGAWNILKAEWGILTASLKIAWETVWNAISSFASTAWEGIKSLATTIWTAISIFFSTTWDGIKTTATTAWNDITTFLSTTWDGIKTKATTTLNGIKKLASDTWDGIKLAWEKASEWFGTNVTTPIDNLFTGLWDGIAISVKNGINVVVGLINALVKKINSISFDIPPLVVLGKVLFDGAHLAFPQIPEIPKLARGGIISSPTLAMIGEGNKKEAVVPLENTSFVDALAGAIGTAVLSAMQFSQSQGPASTQGSGDTIIQIDSTQLARVMIPAINRENKRVGNMAIVQGV